MEQIKRPPIVTKNLHITCFAMYYAISLQLQSFGMLIQVYLSSNEVKLLSTMKKVRLRSKCYVKYCSSLNLFFQELRLAYGYLEGANKMSGYYIFYAGLRTNYKQ